MHACAMCMLLLQDLAAGRILLKPDVEAIFYPEKILCSSREHY